MSKAPPAALLSKEAYRAWLDTALTVSKLDAIIDAYRTDKTRDTADADRARVLALEAQIKKGGVGHVGSGGGGNLVVDKKTKKTSRTDTREPNDAFEAQSKTHKAARPFTLPPEANGKDYCKNLTRGLKECKNLKYKACDDHHDKAPWMTDAYLAWLKDTPSAFMSPAKKASKK